MLPYCHISIGGMVTFPFNHHHHPSATIADIPQYWQWFYCWCLPLLMLLTPMPLTAFTNNPHPHQEPWHQQPHESIHAMYMAMTWWTQVYHYILPFLPFTLNPGAMSLSAMCQPRGWDWRLLKHFLQVCTLSHPTLDGFQSALYQCSLMYMPSSELFLPPVHESTLN